MRVSNDRKFNFWVNYTFKSYELFPHLNPFLLLQPCLGPHRIFFLSQNEGTNTHKEVKTYGRINRMWTAKMGMPSDLKGGVYLRTADSASEELQQKHQRRH